MRTPRGAAAPHDATARPCVNLAPSAAQVRVAKLAREGQQQEASNKKQALSKAQQEKTRELWQRQLSLNEEAYNVLVNWPCPFCPRCLSLLFSCCTCSARGYCAGG